MIPYKKLREKKHILLIIFICLILICLGIKFIFDTKFLHISSEGIAKIFIGIEVHSRELACSASATISDKKEIQEIVDSLNHIRRLPGIYSVDDLGGESPSAWVMFYDKYEVINSIYFYYDIVVHDDNYYKIDLSEYDRLISLCKQYGDSQKRKFQN